MPIPALPPAPAAAIAPLAHDGRIRLNTIGYLPGATKQATVAAKCVEFNVVRISDGEVIYTHTPLREIETPKSDTAEHVEILDFSALQTPGDYRLEIPGLGASDSFKIAADLWNEPYQVASRALYLWRCGTAVETTWKGVTYRHDACHLEDGYLDFVGGGHQHRDATGGWHDAGDYNKYVVNAGLSVGLLLKAWEQFGPQLEHVSTGIPRTANEKVPDLLNEVRWEAEWLLKMQAADGSVFHKLSAQNFKYWGAPDRDVSVRFFCPWGTTATGDFVAMMAETARNWRPYDAAFADRCIAAARKSEAFLLTHLKDIPPDQSAFKTGGYGTPDISHRLWAAAELWETTGDASYLQEFEKRAASFSVDFEGPTWGDVHVLALATYLASQRPGRDAQLVARFQREFIAQADAIVKTSRENGYGRPLGVDRKAWSWGGNGQVAAQTLILHVAERLHPNVEYGKTAQQSLDYLFGRNYHGRSYVTGLGARPPEHPHDRRATATLTSWPGYLVGGPWPDAKTWEDKQGNFKVNEIAINWNTALIYALAAFVEAKG